MKLKERRKKGWSLLECLAYLSITTLLITIQVSSTVSIYSNFYRSLNDNKVMNGITNGFNSVNKIIREEASKDILSIGNKIRIVNTGIDGTSNVKEIYQSGNRLMIEYLTTNNVDELREGKNVLMVNIDSFKVTKKGESFYLEVKSGGENFVQCI